MSENDKTGVKIEGGAGGVCGGVAGAAAGVPWAGLAGARLGASALDFPALRALGHDPVSYETSDGNDLTVCRLCCAMSSVAAEGVSSVT